MTIGLSPKDERISELLSAKNDLSLALELKTNTIQELRSEITSLRGGEIKNLKETIQKLENEIKTWKKTIVAVADDIYLTDTESETVETTATYKSFDDEPAPELVDRTEILAGDFKQRVQRLLRSLKNQKLNMKQQFAKTKFLTNAYKADFEYAESVVIPKQAEIRTEKQLWEVTQISTRLRQILSTLNTAYGNHRRGISLSLIETPLPSTADFPTYNNLSTQTDFNEISKNCFRNLNNIRLKHLEPEALLTASKMKLMTDGKSIIGETLALNKKVEDLTEIFEDEAKKEMGHIEVKIQSETAFMAYVCHLRKHSRLPSRSDIRKLVISDMDASNATYIETSFVPSVCLSNIQGVRNCSSQTEISTLLINFNFEPVGPNDSVKTQIQKLFGQMVKFSIEHAITRTRCKRLTRNVDDLKANKKTSVLQSDLSDGLKVALANNSASNSAKSVKIENGTSKEKNVITSDKMATKLQSMHHEIFAQLERKVKSTLNIEIDAAIEKSKESIKNLQLTSNCSKLRIDEMENKLLIKNHIIDEQSKKIASFDVKNAEAERKLRYETSDKNLANLKLKESHKLLKERESEISKLNTKISRDFHNQTKTNFQHQQAMNLKCKEIQKLKTELNKVSSQQTSQVEINKLKTKITQLEADVRRYKNASSSVSHLEAELHKYKSAAGTVAHLKNQLAEEKKKSEGSGDKPNSEYEMLLSEKDAIIAEYISGSDSKINFKVLGTILSKSYFNTFCKKKIPSDVQK